MNTSVSGSRSICPSNRSWRFLRTSVRSCLTAGPVFFPCDPVPPEAPPERPRATRSDAVETETPRSTRCRHSSARGMSGASARAAWITSAVASILRDRVSPPCGLAARDPVFGLSASQRIAVGGATPISPRLTAGSSPHQSPQSPVLSGPWKVVCPSLPPTSASASVKQPFDPTGIPKRFKPGGKRSNGRLRDELPNGEIFYSLSDANSDRTVEATRQHKTPPQCTGLSPARA